MRYKTYFYRFLSAQERLQPVKNEVFPISKKHPHILIGFTGGRGLALKKRLLLNFPSFPLKNHQLQEIFGFFKGCVEMKFVLKKLKIYWIYRGGFVLKKRLLLNFPLFPLKNHQLFFFFKISRKILSSWNSFENISKNQNFSMNSRHSVIFGKA